MSDDQKIGPVEGSKGTGGAATEIAYCSHLGIYHYRRVDGAEYFFDDAGLEAAVDSYLREGDTRQAEFMVELTALARHFPHQMVSFDAEGKMNLQELLAREIPSDGDVQEAQFSEGKKDGGE